MSVGLIVVLKGETTLPWWAYIVALLLGGALDFEIEPQIVCHNSSDALWTGFVAPFSNLLFARMGNGIATNQLMKMVAAALNPGRPVANLYVRVPLVIRPTVLNCLSVFHVESWCCVKLHQPGGGPQTWAVCEDPTQGHVPYTYDIWLVQKPTIISNDSFYRGLGCYFGWVEQTSLHTISNSSVPLHR